MISQTIFIFPIILAIILINDIGVNLIFLILFLNTGLIIDYFTGRLITVARSLQEFRVIYQFL